MPNEIVFSDLALSKRLEAAEGHACLEFAEARRRAFPKSASEWIEVAGAFAVFDGVNSPATQSFGLGTLGILDSASLDIMERFFRERGAPVLHEVSPLAGAKALDLLCARNYRPFEISNVLYRPLQAPDSEPEDNIRVRVIGSEEAELWASINARGWGHDHPEFLDFMLQVGTIISFRDRSPCFLAEIEGEPGAAGNLSIHEGVALFGGSATIPELRRRGLQAALLKERLRYAFEAGCDLAMIVAETGSNSQRNAERKGFRIAYTRTKWRLCS